MLPQTAVVLSGGLIAVSGDPFGKSLLKIFDPYAEDAVCTSLGSVVKFVAVPDGSLAFVEEGNIRVWHPESEATKKMWKARNDRRVENFRYSPQIDPIPASDAHVLGSKEADMCVLRISRADISRLVSAVTRQTALAILGPNVIPIVLSYLMEGW